VARDCGLRQERNEQIHPARRSLNAHESGPVRGPGGIPAPFRLRARPLDVGPVDAIGVSDFGEGYAQLSGSVRRPDFHWFGPATVILERLSGLPDGAGPEAIRSEFA
jgi:hypothetical protein